MFRRLLLLLACGAAALPAAAVDAFPERLLFQPLLADPRWPRFSGTMQRIHEGEHKMLWSANFGESFALVGTERWQLGLQAGVFSLWDVKTESDDMVNADFIVGLPYSWKRGRLTGSARVFHMSSHLGDEYMLTHDVERLNLSYEALDARFSWDFDGGWRVYGGGGYLYRRYPSDLKPGVVQLGAEYTHLRTVLGLTPVLAVDLQKRQDNGWGVTDVSARAGGQLSHRVLGSRRLLVLLEYYRGHDPNGQWFRRRLEQAGLGAYLSF